MSELTIAKPLKLLARALDPECPEPEAMTSATMFIRVCRKEQITLPVLLKALPARIIDVPIDVGSFRDKRPPACNVEFTFGKYDGWPIGDVAMHDPDYFVWAIRALTKKPELVEAMKIAAAFYGLEVKA